MKQIAIINIEVRTIHMAVTFTYWMRVCVVQ